MGRGVAGVRWRRESCPKITNTTYSPQLLVDRAQLCLVPGVRPAAQEDLVPPFDPALRCRLPEVDLLALVPARVRVEVDPAG